MAKTLDLSDFLASLAAGAPTPGGGSAAAVAGALGAALTAMVARLTAGRKRHAAVEEEMQDIIVQADDLSARLAQLAVDDAAAYGRVSAAYRLPKTTEAEGAARSAAIQEALKAATVTPQETAQVCLAVLRLAARVAEVGNPNAVSDAGVGALLAHAALQGAAYNVRINLADIADPQFVAEKQSAIADTLAEATTLSEKARLQVEARL